jgi:hypothetical protein
VNQNAFGFTEWGRNGRMERKTMYYGPVWAVGQQVEQLAWVENGKVYGCEPTGLEQIGIERDGELFSLDGKPLNLHLEPLGNRAAAAVARQDSEPVRRLRNELLEKRKLRPC